MKKEIRKHKEEQQILLKENKQNIIDFIIDNKDSIRIEDLKIYEPIYKCYTQKGNCHICNNISNIICINCNKNILFMYKSLARTYNRKIANKLIFINIISIS